MYLFLTGAVTNYQKLSDLQQHNFIFLLFWRSEVSSQSHWAKIKVVLGTLDEFLCFPASGGHLHSLAYGLFLIFKPAALDLQISLTTIAICIMEAPLPLTL